MFPHVIKCTSRIVRINKIHVKLNIFLVRCLKWYVAPMSLVLLCMKKNVRICWNISTQFSPYLVFRLIMNAVACIWTVWKWSLYETNFSVFWMIASVKTFQFRDWTELIMFFFSTKKLYTIREETNFLSVVLCWLLIFCNIGAQGVGMWRLKATEAEGSRNASLSQCTCAQLWLSSLVIAI
jgi:hypothetical protein